MSSRDKILARIKASQQKTIGGPKAEIVPLTFSNPVETFKEVLVAIGGAALEVESEEDIAEKLSSILPVRFDPIIVGLDESDEHRKPHEYKDTDIAIIRGQFGVAENGCVWVTDKSLRDRALPFICAHLILIIHQSSIVSTMHDAYEKIGASAYDFGTFIAGPSKTADIEQSLVLGAHGAKTLTCILLKNS